MLPVAVVIGALRVNMEHKLPLSKLCQLVLQKVSIHSLVLLVP